MKAVVVLSALGLMTSLYLLAQDLGSAFGPLKSICEFSSSTSCAGLGW